MKMHCSNDKLFVLAERRWNKSVLSCVSDCKKAIKCEIAGKITGIRLHDDKLLCVAEYSNEKYKRQEVILYTFDSMLNEISKETVFKGNSDASTMDEKYIYIVNYNTGSIGFSEGEVDVVSQLAFIKIDITTKEQTKWDLNNDAGTDEYAEELLTELTNGYVTSIDSMCISDGRLLMECMVYDPDSVVEFEDPEFEDALTHEEIHSFPETLEIQFDERKLVHSFIDLCEFPIPWLRYNEQDVWNITTFDGKIYMSSSRGINCIDTRSTKMSFCRWWCSVNAPQKYRYFYVWNGKLIFEVRDNLDITAFRICPAKFEEPESQEWLEIALQ